jgi:pumilio family protein 6
VRLLLHREASGVLADAFELHANAYERNILLRDFYGKETMLFSFTSGSEQDKERGRKGLRGVLEGQDDDRCRRMLKAVKDNLAAVCVRCSLFQYMLMMFLRFNNSDKGAITHAIVHRALWEYLLALEDVSDEAEREKLRREIYERWGKSQAPHLRNF